MAKIKVDPKKVVPGITLEKIKEGIKEIEKDPEIPNIQDQKFKTVNDRNKWIREQCNKYGSAAYYRSVLKNKI